MESEEDLSSNFDFRCVESYLLSLLFCSCNFKLMTVCYLSHAMRFVEVIL